MCSCTLFFAAGWVFSLLVVVVVALVVDVAKVLLALFSLLLPDHFAAPTPRDLFFVVVQSVAFRNDW